MKRCNYSRIIRLAAFLCSAVFLAACNNLFDPPAGTAAPGEALVSISIGGSPSRTVAPEVDPANYRYVLKGAIGDGEQADLGEVSYAEGTTLSLTPAQNWNFTLSAYDDENDSLEVLRGIVNNKALVSGETNQVVFNLAFVKEERSGDIAITVNFPDYMNINIIKVNSAISGTQQEEVFTLISELETFVPGTFTYEKSELNAGDYPVIISLYSRPDGGSEEGTDDTLMATVTEIVKVGGWFTSAKTIILSAADIKSNIAQGTNLQEKLQWIIDTPQSGGNYLVEVSGTESLEPFAFTGGGLAGAIITLTGTVENSVINLSAAGSMFTVADGVTLVLDNITLKGREDNNAALVSVNDGTLILTNGAAITGNTNTVGSGGGVYVGSNGIFNMTGGTIHGFDEAVDPNTVTLGTGASLFVEAGGSAAYGGAFETDYGIGPIGTREVTLPVELYEAQITNFGDFTLDEYYPTLADAITAANEVTTSEDNPVEIKLLKEVIASAFYNVDSNRHIRLLGNNKTITSRVTTVSLFTVQGNASLQLGDGNDASGTLTLNKDTVATDPHSGVNVNGTLVMRKNTTIEGFTNSGVQIMSGPGTFIMEGGTISGNTSTAIDSGGGVTVNSNGIFTMQGGTIKGNTADQGGGVYVSSNGNFTMSGGTIHGSGETVEPNTATDVSGNSAAIFVDPVATAAYGGDYETTYGTGEIGTQEVTLPVLPEAEIAGVKYITLAGAISNAAAGSTITVLKDITAGQAYIVDTQTFTLRGDTAGRKIHRPEGSGNIFTVSGGQLTLGENITLEGNDGNTDPLVTVNSGILVMETGSKLTGNKAGLGGGVYLPDGSFNMNGGTISGNTASQGGGVYVGGGTFTMSGGTIHGSAAGTDSNTATTQNTAAIYVDPAATATYANGYGTGGAISSSDDTLPVLPEVQITNAASFPDLQSEYATLKDAILAAYEKGSETEPVEIKLLKELVLAAPPPPTGEALYTVNTHIRLLGGNHTIYFGAGGMALFMVPSGGSLTLGNTDGSGGTLTLDGGTYGAAGGAGRRGVSVSKGKLVMNANTTITGFKNTGSGTSGYGGAVYLINNSSFTMQGGTIKGNTANQGGGVYLGNDADFIMSGGTVYGSGETEPNTATGGTGAAIYVEPSAAAQYGGGYTATYGPGEIGTRDVTLPFELPDITYNVTPVDGMPGVADSTGLRFTFHAPIDSLAINAADITVAGAAAKGENPAFTKLGTDWVLSPITVTAQEAATVSIANPRIKTGQSVQVYAAPRYTVTFDSAGGSAVNPILQVKSGSTITKPADPTREGYAFNNWYNLNGTPDTSDDTLWNFTADPVRGNITLSAKWSAAGLTITYDNITDPLAGTDFGTVRIKTSGSSETETEKYTHTFTLAEPELYVDGSISWTINRTGITGSGAAFTLDTTLPANEAYDKGGTYELTLEVITKNGNIPYSLTIEFEVVQDT